MLNRAIIMGRLTSDPELKRTPGDIAVCTFSVAVDRAYSKDKQTDFIDIVVWRKTAEFVCKYFKKGDMIAVEGRIETRSYTDKDGNKRKAFEIVADNVSFCGGKRETAPATTPASDDFVPVGADDDLPF